MAEKIFEDVKPRESTRHPNSWTCEKCGEKNPMDADFCKKCGASSAYAKSTKHGAR